MIAQAIRAGGVAGDWKEKAQGVQQEIEDYVRQNPTKSILAAVGAWQMGSLMAFFDKSYAKAGATIVLVYLVGMILIWFAPETKDKPLPE